ncbi:MAG: hypothetical protein Q9166_008225 [cf. Caloplaca sp. 2 TL-2023]
MDTPPAYFNLLGLPKELLLRIIEHELHHEDLENLTLCSRTMFDLSKKARTKHLNLKRKFSTFSVGNIRVHNGRFQGLNLPPVGLHPVFALRQLLENDALIDYCRTLKLGSYDELRPISAYRSHDSAVALCTLLEETFEPTLSSHISGTGSLLNGDYDRAYAAIFAILQNIEILEIVISADFILKVAPNLPLFFDTHCRLQEIRLFGHRDGGETLESLFLMASIPSVRRIYGLHMDGKTQDHYYRNGATTSSGSCPPVGSIEDIYFECSAINGSSFEGLLSAVNALKTFYYENSNDILFGCNLFFEPRRLISNLREYASESLESLTLVDLGWGESLGDKDVKTLGSLRNFRKLKYAAIECSLFIVKEDPEEEDRALETGYYSEQDLGYDISRLVDVLPPTLETLRLHHPRDSRDVQVMFSSLAEFRAERLPNLRHITVNGEVMVGQEIEDACHQVGIELVVASRHTLSKTVLSGLRLIDRYA